MYSIVYSILLTIAFMLVFWGYIFIQSNIIVQDRLSDLVYLVSEENCLSKDGGTGVLIENTPYGTYRKLLEQSETPWLRFERGFDVDRYDSFDVGVQRGDGSFGDKYYTYAAAPQRGSAINVRVSARLYLPILLFPDSKIAKAIPNTIEIDNKRYYYGATIVKDYTTMGLKFYKGKEAV